MKIKQVLLIVLAIFLVVFLACDQEHGYKTLKMEEYVDKCKAGWVGQMVGVGWGAPTEFQYCGKIIPEEEMPKYKPEMVNQFYQDDIYVEMTFLRTLEKHGFDASIKQAGIDFANSKYPLWHANKAGRDNLRSGIAPPNSSHPKYNSHADDIDYQIEADYSGLIAPGMPNLVIELGNKFGRLMNYGDGVYGGQFVGAMYSKAFFETDIMQIIQAGLAAIPAESQYAECIKDVIKWHQENPDDWQKTWRKIEDKYNDNPKYRKFSCNGAENDLNIDAKINGAYIVMGLLYGEGDIEKTIIISTRCGQDSDCNPSNAAGILFTTLGFENLPDKYKSELKYDTPFSHTEYDFSGLIDVCKKLTIEGLRKKGGEVITQEGAKILRIPQRSPKPNQLQQSWDPAPPADVEFTAKDMKQIKFKSYPAEDYITDWKVAGPYAKEGKTAIDLFKIEFPPEIDNKKVQWSSIPDSISNKKIKFEEYFARQHSVIYLRNEIHSPEQQKVYLSLGSDDGIKIWLNGKQIFAKNVKRACMPDEDKVEIELEKGWNDCLVKLTQATGGWSAAFRIMDEDTETIKGLKFKTE